MKHGARSAGNVRQALRALLQLDRISICRPHATSKDSERSKIVHSPD